MKRLALYWIALLALPGALSAAPLDVQKLDDILRVAGDAQPGRYKASFPQKSLRVSLDGFELPPAMGLVSWAAFAPHKKGAAVTGEFIILEDEAALVEQTAVQGGLKITALHGHFLRETPKIASLHVAGLGTLQELARAVAAVAERVDGLRAAKGPPPAAEPAPHALETRALETILGAGASDSGGAVKFLVGDAWLAFTGSMQKAAVAGEFTPIREEAERVIAILLFNKIEVTAMHDQSIHFWGTGPATVLARGLKAALGETRRKRR